MKVTDPCGCFPTGKHYPGIIHLMRLQVQGLIAEIDASAPWREQLIAFIDTETTGIDSKTDRVIEIGIVFGRGGRIERRQGWLINPGMPIPKQATAVHGISDEQVAAKPSFAELAATISKALAGAIPAAYNAPFDKGFVLAEIDRAGYRDPQPAPAFQPTIAWIDPLVWARELFKGRGVSRALGAVAERLGVSLEHAHRATDDAEAALRVLYQLGKDEQLPRGYGALIREQRRLDAQQAEARRFWRK